MGDSVRAHPVAVNATPTLAVAAASAACCRVRAVREAVGVAIGRGRRVELVDRRDLPKLIAVMNIVHNSPRSSYNYHQVFLELQRRDRDDVPAEPEPVAEQNEEKEHLQHPQHIRPNQAHLAPRAQHACDT